MIGPHRELPAARVVFSDLFNWYLKQEPPALEIDFIFPVPKISASSVLNDYQSMALISVIVMCFERLVLTPILQHNGDRLDPLQSAYTYSRRVEDEDAVLTLSQCAHSPEKA